MVDLNQGLGKWDGMLGWSGGGGQGGISFLHLTLSLQLT